MDANKLSTTPLIAYPMLGLLLFLSGCGSLPAVCTTTEFGGCFYYVISQYDERGNLNRAYDSDGFLFHRVEEDFRLFLNPDMFLDSQDLLWLVDSDDRFLGPGQQETIRVKIYSEGGRDFSGSRPPPDRYESSFPVDGVSSSISDFRPTTDIDGEGGGSELRWNRDGRGVLNSLFLCLRGYFKHACALVDPLTGFDRTFGDEGWINVVTGGIEGNIRVASHWKMNDLFLAADLSEDDVWTDGDRSSGFEVVLLKYRPTGDPDLSFGTAGRVVLPLPSRPLGRARLSASEVDVDSRDRVLVMYGQSYPDSAPRTYQLVRLLPSGEVDTTFADAGVLDLTSRSIPYRATQMILQADNKILVSRGHFLSRFNEDGTLDSSFGFWGSMPMPPLPDGTPSGIRSVQLDALSRIYVLAGDYRSANIYRLTSSGASDFTYPVGSRLNYQTAVDPEGGLILSFVVDTNSEINPKVYVLAQEHVDP